MGTGQVPGYLFPVPPPPPSPAGRRLLQLASLTVEKCNFRSIPEAWLLAVLSAQLSHGLPGSGSSKPPSNSCVLRAAPAWRGLVEGWSRTAEPDGNCRVGLSSLICSTCQTGGPPCPLQCNVQNTRTDVGQGTNGGASIWEFGGLGQSEGSMESTAVVGWGSGKIGVGRTLTFGARKGCQGMASLGAWALRQWKCVIR